MIRRLSASQLAQIALKQPENPLMVRGGTGYETPDMPALPGYQHESAATLPRANGFGDRAAMGIEEALQSLPPVSRYIPNGDAFGQSFVRGLASGFAEPRLANMEESAQANVHAQQEADARNKMRMADEQDAGKEARQFGYALRLRQADRAAQPKSAVDPGYTIRGDEKGLQKTSYKTGQVIPSDLAQSIGWLNKVYPPKESAVADDDVNAFAQGLHDGTIPPTAVQGRPTQYVMKVYGALRKLDPTFSLTKAGLDYAGLRQHVMTLNGQQQTAFRRSAETAGMQLDYIKELNDKLTASIPRSQFDLFNQGGLTAARQGLCGPQAADLATQLTGQIQGVASELGRFYAGGSAPTDESNARAAHVINENFAPNRIIAGIASAKRDINNGLTAVSEAGAITPSNPQTIGTPQRSFKIAGATISLGTGRVRMQPPDGGQPMEFSADQQAEAESNGWKVIQ